MIKFFISAIFYINVNSLIVDPTMMWKKMNSTQLDPTLTFQEYLVNTNNKANSYMSKFNQYMSNYSN